MIDEFFFLYDCMYVLRECMHSYTLKSSRFVFLWHYLSFHCVGSGTVLQISGLVGRIFTYLSHLTGPSNHFQPSFLASTHHRYNFTYTIPEYVASK